MIVFIGLFLVVQKACPGNWANSREFFTEIGEVISSYPQMENFILLCIIKMLHIVAQGKMGVAWTK